MQQHKHNKKKEDRRRKGSTNPGNRNRCAQDCHITKMTPGWL